jgi:hypothetical protein
VIILLIDALQLAVINILSQRIQVSDRTELLVLLDLPILTPQLIITSCRTWPNVRKQLFIVIFLVLYDFTNKEHDMIMRCFRIGNYTSLRDLPNKLAAN